MCTEPILPEAVVVVVVVWLLESLQRYRAYECKTVRAYLRARVCYCSNCLSISLCELYLVLASAQLTNMYEALY